MATAGPDELMQAVFQVDDHAEFWNVTIVLSEEKNPPRLEDALYLGHQSLDAPNVVHDHHHAHHIERAVRKGQRRVRHRGVDARVGQPRELRHIRRIPRHVYGEGLALERFAESRSEEDITPAPNVKYRRRPSLAPLRRGTQHAQRFRASLLGAVTGTGTIKCAALFDGWRGVLVRMDEKAQRLVDLLVSCAFRNLGLDCVQEARRVGARGDEQRFVDGIEQSLKLVLNLVVR